MNQDDHNTPKIGCVNHDCDKCKAQQPVAYVYEREIDGFGLRKDVKFLKPVEVGSDLYTSPPPRKPLTQCWKCGDMDAEFQAKCTVPACGMKEQPAQQQEPVACPVCNEVHAILDADDSKIIRNAEDGYPDGRELRVLTLQERVTALCVYAADWKRWCLEKENTPPPRKPLTDEEIWDEVKAADLDWQTGWSLDEDAPNRYITFARAIEAAHGIARE